MIKKLCKKIIVIILSFEARLVLLRFRPKIIAVVGSVGKTSTKDAIYTALHNTVSIRKNKKSFNSELGAPLTILDLENAWNNPTAWMKNIGKGFLRIFQSSYPKFLVLEVGADHPGDVRKLARWIRPHVVVVTSLPEMPVHVEYFESPEALIEEDISILEYLRKDGVLVINTDEALAEEIIKRSKVKTFTYGSADRATVSFSNHSITYSEDALPTGIAFKVSYTGNSLPIMLPGVIGVTHMYPVVAALAVGVAQDVPLLEMIKTFEDHKPPAGRMNLIDGIAHTCIIDDSYNASPIAVARALETLASVRSIGPKIAIFGDMLELGKYATAEHKKVGALTSELKIDYLIAVGSYAHTVAEAAIESGMKTENVFVANNASEAIILAEPLFKSGAIILVKGSQGIRLEKVVAQYMQFPEQKKERLVRQEPEWENR